MTDHDLMSPQAFKVLLTVLTVIGAMWALHDVLKLPKLAGADNDDPIVADKKFGYAIGIAIGVCGWIGILRFNGVI